MFFTFRKIVADQEKILTTLEKLAAEGRVQRPPNFPLATVQGLKNMEEMDNEAFHDLVVFYRQLGGFTLKEMVTSCLKESIAEELASHVTWLGKKEGKEALNSSKITFAIYEAAKMNRYFNLPSRSEFKSVMIAALRAAQERARARRGRSNVSVRNIWDE
ncbi:uncharacterized protein LOC113464986 [Ceratina calcarata]|uniref:Uncharacterized protein LOC113464986 n=1 Tax=Ceratina calcarata TaxID=156304 RepID=A0AAJ7SAX3_9HYME|nr:uncharacterized protein LOC113464986 [Ceratina calcarata]